VQIGLDVSFPSAIGPMPGLPVEVEVGLLLPAAIGLRDPAGEFMLLVSAIYFLCYQVSAAAFSQFNQLLMR
jgi:TctA family transporter